MNSWTQTMDGIKKHRHPVDQTARAADQSNGLNGRTASTAAAGPQLTFNLVEGWRAACPYGRWACAEGREVIFNRDYWPILEKYPGEPARALREYEWVKYENAEWFYHDCTSSRELLARVNKELREWGLRPLGPRPRRNGWQPNRYRKYGCGPVEGRRAFRNPWVGLAL